MDETDSEKSITSRHPTPSITEFDPTVIPYQIKVINDIKHNFDYSLGKHEILLSGSVGSAKSLLMAHIATVVHCLEHDNACVLIARKAMPDLRDTIFRDIIDHISPDMREGLDYAVNQTRCSIVFSNGSSIISRSWADKKYKKFRSLKLSAAIIEELTENDQDDKEAYDEIALRVGRVPGITQNFILCASNPDEPTHWAAEYFLESKLPTRHVYYSITTDNPFLPKTYVQNLLTNLSPEMARRMVYGEWLSIGSDVIYSSYSKEHNFRDYDYKINPYFPIHITHDFNIGTGKPMSAVAFQYINDEFHFFDEFIVEGARTGDIMEEIGGGGILQASRSIIVNGDCNGRSRDTRGTQSDYDIIDEYLRRHNISFEIRVPSANPPVRKRHNDVNAYFCNALGKRRCFVYKKCPTLDKGLRLTKLVKGGKYLEQEIYEQHCTTALGYGIIETLILDNMAAPGSQPR